MTTLEKLIPLSRASWLYGVSHDDVSLDDEPLYCCYASLSIDCPTGVSLCVSGYIFCEDEKNICNTQVGEIEGIEVTSSNDDEFTNIADDCPALVDYFNEYATAINKEAGQTVEYEPM